MPVLLTITGRDRPGITAALADVLAARGEVLLDVEQVVVAGRLTLAVAVSDRGAGSESWSRSGPARTPSPLLEQLRASPALTGLEIDAHVVADGANSGAPDAPGPVRHHVTVLGPTITPAALSAVAAAVTGSGANIERIERMASYPVVALGLVVRGGEPGPLRAALAAASSLGVDVAVERAGLHRRAKRLLVMDVDSTLVQGEVIEMLAERAGCGPQVAAVTTRAMAGELDFEASLRSRVALLAGLPASALTEVAASLRLARGARTLVRTVKRLGYQVGVVSGGFSQVVDPLAAQLGLDFAVANTLEVAAGRLTGALTGPVLDRAGKAAALRRFAAGAGIPLAQTVAIGDGANDVEMLAAAGLGIAYNAKPVVARVADAAVSVPYLDAVLFLLGLTREEIEQADAEAPAGAESVSGSGR